MRINDPNFVNYVRSESRGFVALVISTLLLVSGPAVAQNSWTMSISEKEMKLEHPVDMMWNKWLMWDIGYQRMMCRNAPYIELQNDAASTSPITEFHLTIGDGNFHFAPLQDGKYALLGSSTPGFDLTSTTLNSLGDELIVTIGQGGLAHGQAVRFQINIDVDANYAATYSSLYGSSQPDYRTVLFDMNGLNVYTGVQQASSDDNAEGSVVFSPGGQSDPIAFADEFVPAAQYYNNNLRPYRSSDPVLIFQPSVLMGGIPEPSSGVLMVLAAVTLTYCRRFR